MLVVDFRNKVRTLWPDYGAEFGINRDLGEVFDVLQRFEHRELDRVTRRLSG